MRSDHILAVAVTAVVLTASGVLPKDAAIAGAGYGAAAGALGGALLGAPVVAGFVVGGAAGAVYASYQDNPVAVREWGQVTRLFTTGNLR